MSEKVYRIAVIPGDGIGREVMPEGMRALDAVTRRFGIRFEATHIDWASCDYYAQHGQMMPDDWKAQLAGMDAMLFGAVGWPDTVPDHISLWGSLLKFRREFDQYVNLRPVRLFDGVPCPLANRKAGDIDFMIVRENTEGEYSSVGGAMFEGTEREFVVQQAVFTRTGTERVLKFAFDLAQSRAQGADRGHQEQRHRDQHAVVGCARGRDRAAVSRGDMGQAAHRHPLRALRAEARTLRRGGRLQPVRRHPVGSRPGLHRHDRHRALGEPEPGAQVPLAVRARARFGARHLRASYIANPIAMIWSAAMMLDFLGHGTGVEREAHDAILAAIEHVLKHGPRTGDLGGKASTQEVGEAVVAQLLA